jgi:hypothetical protein
LPWSTISGFHRSIVLRDPQALAEREMFVSLRALKQLQKEPVLGAFDLAHYAATSVPS